MYYFYIVESPSKRIGFGIAQNVQERNKQYCSHCGDIVSMTVYGGQRSHAKALERTIKKQYIDNLWQIEDWTTEWLNKDITREQLVEYVNELIETRHIKVDSLVDDYNFTMGNII